MKNTATWALVLGLASAARPTAAQTSSAPPSDETAVREVIGRYLHGLQFNDVASLKTAFLPGAKLFFVKRDGSLGELSQADWYKGFEPNAGKREEGDLRIVSVDITGNAASAKIREDYPASIYTDYVSLLKLPEGWRIVNKIYTSERRAKPAASMPSKSRVLSFAELNAESLASLVPERTAFILANGPIEEHGPHLPSGADTYQCEYAARHMAESLADALPDWTIVFLPTLWYGVDGANLIPDRHDIRGTVSLRGTTLRAIAVDLGTQLADQGFRWIFLVHDHGAPLEHVALSDAADYVRQSRHIGMFNVSSIGFFDGDPAVHAAVVRRYSEAEHARIAFDIHAGTSETSAMLAVRPDLVSPAWRTLPDLTVHDLDEMEAAGKRPEWRGYWSAPALADADLGRKQVDAMGERWARLALRAIGGEDIGKLPRYPDDPPIPGVKRQADRSLAAQQTAERQFQKWLETRGSMLDRPPN